MNDNDNCVLVHKHVFIGELVILYIIDYKLLKMS